jgi:periplasmic protein TonB
MPQIGFTKTPSEARELSAMIHSTNWATLDDIVFSQRNQGYGAYHIRQTYGNTVRKAVLAGVFAFVLALVGSTILARVEKNEVTSIEVNVGDFEIPKTPPEQPKPQTPPPVEPPKEMPRKTIEFTVPEIVEETDQVLTDQETLDKTDAQISNKTQDGSTEPLPVEMPEDPAPREATPVKVDEPETPFIAVEIQPEFMGGRAAFMKFLQKNLKYPQPASSAGIGGKVFVEFVVSRDGKIQQAHVVKGVGFGCDEEALRVVNLMPNWQPGRQSGREVPVRFTLPIAFVLE